MFLLSTGKSTILTEYENLETKASYQHANSESVDFQFYSHQQVFVEVNKKSGLEILRLKEKTSNEVQIQRVQKLNIENVFCVACVKQSLDEMAFGLTNGQVKIYNYKNSKFVHRFSTENTRNCVFFVDYNAADEYIAAVFENGQINTYGMKTKTKVDSFKIDGQSTLARFHPSKRFHLAIASFKGAVSLYDVQTKKILYHSHDSHAAPCQDLSMCCTSPDTLLSAGFDCCINIFDTRRKQRTSQLKYSHPLASITMSACGNYFCVGSLKGDLAAYDMRNTKTLMYQRKVHNEAVTRVGFVPNFELKLSKKSISNASIASNQILKCTTPEANNTTSTNMLNTHVNRDSFYDMLDYQPPRMLDNSGLNFAARRESFDWEALFAGRTNDKAIVFNSTVNMSMDYVNTKPRKSKSEPQALCEISASNEIAGKSPKKLHKSLERIIENSELNLSTEKENFPIEISNWQPENKSTPTTTISRISLPKETAATFSKEPSSEETPTITNDTRKNIQQNQSDVMKAIADLRLEMNERMHNMEEDLKFNAETNKWNIFTQNANFWHKQSLVNEDFNNALALLLHTDPFVNELVRLREENENLRAQLKKLTRKIN